MEHWGSLQEHNLSMLLRLISQIQKVHAASKDDSESVVLQIELQAVLQAALNAFASDVVSSHLGHKVNLAEANGKTGIWAYAMALNTHFRYVLELQKSSISHFR
jgi:hypothetical protein